MMLLKKTKLNQRDMYPFIKNTIFKQKLKKINICLTKKGLYNIIRKNTIIIIVHPSFTKKMIKMMFVKIFDIVPRKVNTSQQYQKRKIAFVKLDSLLKADDLLKNLGYNIN